MMPTANWVAGKAQTRTKRLTSGRQHNTGNKKDKGNNGTTDQVFPVKRGIALTFPASMNNGQQVIASFHVTPKSSIAEEDGLSKAIEQSGIPLNHSRGRGILPGEFSAEWSVKSGMIEGRMCWQIISR